MIDLELREKVARLLGWRQAHDGAWIMPPKITDDATTAGALWELPPYETDVAAAWEAVEFMRKKKKKRLHLHERKRGDWFAEFVPTETGQAYQRGCVASTAPLAICMAFVAAMENNHES